MVPGVFGSFMSSYYMEPSWFPFSDLQPSSGNIDHFWNKKAFFRWFHVVPGVFSFIMLKCYKEFRWFPFQILSLLSEINHFWNESAFFLDGFMWFPVFLAPL